MRRRNFLLILPAMFLPAMFLAAAVPLLRPWPPGQIQREISAPLPGGGAYTIVASREERGNNGLFQYYLSIYAATPGVAWHRAFLAPAGGNSVIPLVVQGHGTTRFFPAQTLKLLGTVPIQPHAAPFAVAEMHNTGADCGTGTVILLGKIKKRFGSALVISNPCALTAKIARDYVELAGPYYAKDAPLYKPTIVHARAALRYRHGHFVEIPDYFRFDPRFTNDPPNTKSDPGSSPGPLPGSN